MAKISNTVREHIFSRDGYECLRCWVKDNLTIDHIIPLSKGGTNRMGNMQTLCMGCNSDKGNNIVDYRWVEHIPKSWFNLSIPINELGITDEVLPVIVDKCKNPFAEPKKKKLKQIVKELGFYDNPITMERDIFLMHQTPEQFAIAKQHGWRIAKMLTEPEPNFHYE